MGNDNVALILSIIPNLQLWKNRQQLTSSALPCLAFIGCLELATELKLRYYYPWSRLTFILFISPRSLSTSRPDSRNSPMETFPEEEAGRENTRAISSARHSPGDRSRPLSRSPLPGVLMANRSENGIMTGMGPDARTFARTSCSRYRVRQKFAQKVSVFPALDLPPAPGITGDGKIT